MIAHRNELFMGWGSEPMKAVEASLGVPVQSGRCDAARDLWAGSFLHCHCRHIIVGTMIPQLRRANEPEPIRSRQ